MYMLAMLFVCQTCSVLRKVLCTRPMRKKCISIYFNVKTIYVDIAEIVQILRQGQRTGISAASRHFSGELFSSPPASTQKLLQTFFRGGLRVLTDVHSICCKFTILCIVYGGKPPGLNYIYLHHSDWLSPLGAVSAQSERFFSPWRWNIWEPIWWPSWGARMATSSTTSSTAWKKDWNHEKRGVTLYCLYMSHFLCIWSRML